MTYCCFVNHLNTNMEQEEMTTRLMETVEVGPNDEASQFCFSVIKQTNWNIERQDENVF